MVQTFVEHWGDNLQVYSNFALFSTLGGEPRPRYFLGEEIKRRPKKEVFARNGTLFSPNSGEDQKKKKKGFHQKWNTFFPNLSTDLRSDAHHSQIIGWDIDEDYNQIVRGYTVKSLGEIYPPIPPPPPPGFGTPGRLIAVLLRTQVVCFFT